MATDLRTLDDRRLPDWQRKAKPGLQRIYHLLDRGYERLKRNCAAVGRRYRADQRD